MYSKIIPIFSFEWWISFTGFALLLLVGLVVPFFFSETWKKRVAYFLPFFLIWDALFLQFYLHHKGVWDILSSLPLQYCNLMTLFGALALLTRWHWAFEIALFLGLIEPFQAIITPGFAYSGSEYLIFDYYFSHFGAIYAALYLGLHAKMSPRKGAWWRITLTFFAACFLVMAIDKCLGANYMFLLERPDIKHPLNLGIWPFYLLVWALEVLGISFIINRFARSSK